jgi:hypothetical protein
MMRALSLWQPHATLMALLRPEPNPRRVAEKPFETRPLWARRIACGELLIHAAKREDQDAYRSPAVAGALADHGMPDVVLGAGVCVVDVVAVWGTSEAEAPRSIILLRTVDQRVHGRPGRVAHLPSGRIGALGDFGPDRVLLECANVRPLREPVPLRGRQGLFNLTAEEEAAVRAALPITTEVARG